MWRIKHYIHFNAMGHICCKFGLQRTVEIIKHRIIYFKYTLFNFPLRLSALIKGGKAPTLNLSQRSVIIRRTKREKREKINSNQWVWVGYFPRGRKERWVTILLSLPQKDPMESYCQKSLLRLFHSIPQLNGKAILMPPKKHLNW